MSALWGYCVYLCEYVIHILAGFIPDPPLRTGGEVSYEMNISGDHIQEASAPW